MFSLLCLLACADPLPATTGFDPSGNPPPGGLPGGGMPPGGPMDPGALPPGGPMDPGALPPGGPMDPSGMTPPPVDPNAPAGTVQPVDPNAGGANSTAPTLGAVPGTWAPAGTGVKVSGTFTYAGSKVGTYHIDILPQNGTPNAVVAASLVPTAPGPFEIEAPTAVGSISMFAYLDVTGDGLSPDDPAGGLSQPITVGSSAVTGISITIVDR